MLKRVELPRWWCAEEMQRKLINLGKLDRMGWMEQMGQMETNGGTWVVMVGMKRQGRSSVLGSLGP
jgi:hypothetical protein